MMISVRSWYNAAFRKNRYVSFMKQTAMYRKKNYLPESVPDKYVSSLAAPRKWEQAQMCRTD